MLLFKPEHVDMILSGRKTQTRRNWKKRRAVVGSIHQARTKLFGKPFAYLKILKVKQQYLDEISNEDCIKEGYNNFSEFRIIWMKINSSWDESQKVFVVEFVITEGKDK